MHQIPFHIRPSRFQNSAPGHKHTVGTPGKAVTIQAERLPQQTLGPRPIDRTPERSLGSHHPHTRRIHRPVRNPQHLVATGRATVGGKDTPIVVTAHNPALSGKTPVVARGNR